MQAIITGANGDMGLAICEYFIDKKYNTIAIDKNIQRLNSQSINISSDFSSLNTLENDLKNFNSPVDVLVYAAGVREITPAIELTSIQWQEVISVNLTAAFILCQHFSKLAIQHQVPLNIILVSSISGLQGEPQRSAYCASKHGLIGMAKSLAIELAPFQIRVNVIAPGIIETGMTKPYQQNPTLMKQLEQNIPLKQWGKCSDIVKTVDFIINNDYLTGSTIVVDGGWTAGKTL